MAESVPSVLESDAKGDIVIHDQGAGFVSGPKRGELQGTALRERVQSFADS